jgi:hypothetical protein
MMGDRSLILFFVTAACGTVKGDRPIDAPNPIDANLNDADLTGTATVITQTHAPGSGAVGALQGMVDVVSLLPNGMVKDQIKTDATGHGTIKVFPGGSVTAIYRHTLDAGADLATIMGVKPNDVLTFGKNFAPGGTATSLGSETITWPAVANTGEFEIFWPCGATFPSGAATSVVIGEQDICNRSPMGLLAVSLNSSTFQVQSMSFTNFTFANGGSQPLNGFVGTSNGTATITNIDPAITSVFYNLGTIANGGQQLFSSGTSVVPTGGSATITTPYVATGDRTVSTLFMSRPGGYFSQRVVDSLGFSLNVTVDNPPELPWLVGSPIVNGGTRLVEWEMFGPVNHDGTVVLLNWNHIVNAVSSPFAWSFVVPPNTTSFSLPTLPGLFSDTQPHPEDGIGRQLDLVRIPSLTGGYDAFRQLPEANTTCATCAVNNNVFQRAIISGN